MRRVGRRQVGLSAAIVTLVVASLWSSGAVVLASPADTDLDGLHDAFESASGGLLDPMRGDSDGDGVIDPAEDPDRDGLSNLGEQRNGTLPERRDSDGDGILDGDEDSDRDGRSDGREQDRRRLPLGLRPTLEGASLDVPAERAGCQSQAGVSELTICDFSPEQPGRTVVLMGDSHAMMYMPALGPIAAAQGWRLLTLVKSGCIPLLGTHNSSQRDIDGGASCRLWRRNALSWLAATRPEVIIMAYADSYKLVDARGGGIRVHERPAVWKAGMLRTLAALPHGAKVLVMGDVPENDHEPVACLERHRNDMAACVSPWEPPEERVIERAIREAVVQRHAAFGSIYAKICPYDPCPLVQGEVLMWRDGSHLTRTFVEQLTPAIRALLAERLGLARRGHARRG